MRILNSASIAIAVLSLCGMPAHAEGAPWCAYKSNGGTNCGFYSWEQCKANIYGNDNCGPNPQYSGTKDSRRRQR
jgi:Protein of unknown function (DUF3551)